MNLYCRSSGNIIFHIVNKNHKKKKKCDLRIISANYIRQEHFLLGFFSVSPGLKVITLFWILDWTISMLIITPPKAPPGSTFSEGMQTNVKCPCGGVAVLARAAAPVRDRLLLGGLCLSAAVLGCHCRLSAHVKTKSSVGEPAPLFTKLEKGKKEKAKARRGAVCKLNCSGLDYHLTCIPNISHKLLLSA